ncbi:MAG: multicopper oxidase family protein [Undibacterium sp.]
MKKYLSPLILAGIVITLGIGAWWLGGRPVAKVNELTISRTMDQILAEAQPMREVALADGETYDLSIQPVMKEIDGRKVRMLAYNGSIPGPTLHVSEGSRVTVRLKNDGDRATTLHAHGVRMDNAFDGVPDMTQKEIAPGETFTYELKFPDAGVFWYHPHVRTDYALESGLYGNIIVTSQETAYWGKANREVPLMIDDIALDQQGLLPFDDKRSDHTLMGRFGNVMLINGVSDFNLSVKQGEVVRLYLTDAANTRLFNVAIPKAKMKLVGADIGRYTKEQFIDEVLLAPGERRVVDTLFTEPGTYTIEHRTPGKLYTLGTVTVTKEKAAPDYALEYSKLRTNESVVQEIESVMAKHLARSPDKSLRLTLDMNTAMQGMMNSQGGHMGGGHMTADGSMMSGAGMGMGDDGDSLEWEDTMAMMNRSSTSETVKWKLVDMATGKANMDISDWSFKRGEEVKIRIFNDPMSMHPMQHPIHFHGQRFIILATNGERNPNPVWMDTALVPKGDTVDILLEASNPGNWMVHCHILEHAESGMMFGFKVE